MQGGGCAGLPVPLISTSTPAPLALRTGSGMFLEMSSGARQALFAIDRKANTDERQFVAKAMGRAALAAYDRIIDARHSGPS